MVAHVGTVGGLTWPPGFAQDGVSGFALTFNDAEGRSTSSTGSELLGSIFVLPTVADRKRKARAQGARASCGCRCRILLAAVARRLYVVVRLLNMLVLRCQ